MIFDGFVHQLPDIDPDETQEWLDSLDAVVDTHGKTRARFLLSKLLERAARAAGRLPGHGVARRTSTPSRREQEPWFPGDEYIERRIRAFIRWNAAVMVDQGQQARRRHRRPPVDVRLVGRRSTRSASTTSSAARTTAAPATRSTSRATPRPASTPAPSSRAGSPRTQLDHFRREIGGERPVVATRTRGSCPTSGSSRRCRWASARSTRSTRPASTATCTTASIDDTSAVAGVVLRRRRRERRARDARRASRSPPASSSTT